MSHIQVKKLSTQTCYSWADEYGFHQYYMDCVDEVGEIIGFQRIEKDGMLMYSWNDKTGYHMYHLEL